MKSLFAAIALVAACSVASAAEVQKDIKAPVVASKTMTDADMDRVTAGRVFPSTKSGIYTAGSIVSPQQSVQGTTHGCGTCNRP